jgi:alkanesulfonate monooxygenase SsuD/methylene tetrahydromethanopterin reductase-like flavin-dependent oxidoreductase (luciferase family)
VEGPADVAIAGDEETVAAQIRGFFDAGATGFIASAFGSAPEREATLRFLGRLGGD